MKTFVVYVCTAKEVLRWHSILLREFYVVCCEQDSSQLNAQLFFEMRLIFTLLSEVIIKIV